MEGMIKAIEPVIKENTRTLKLKILVENKNNLLKPNMYVDVFLKIDVGERLAIPYSAVLDTGERKIAFVDLGEGRYQLREIKIGPKVSALIHNHKQNFYILEEGIEEAEKVVVKGNYLLDSQSQLGTAGAAYGGSLEAEKPKVHQH
jgi:Cu(I)/Ag(I) efflux system membrane fusion protein